eukprot:CAMPEP_0196724130 /NCGR_PEP_ID=MMETSP1091-20130531/6122_1 /TAXON_ID=302021 /ORGANISM="Rhodomonas sp., Strain CCMP768" /LENGTH=115 /DNA_ID=CAMNT_0042066229 /DNA_START=272 /DNA_END=619 /DNA_ORIENTATION=-
MHSVVAYTPPIAPNVLPIDAAFPAVCRMVATAVSRAVAFSATLSPFIVSKGARKAPSASPPAPPTVALIVPRMTQFSPISRFKPPIISHFSNLSWYPANMGGNVVPTGPPPGSAT